MKSKPGVFDPWRQDDEVPEEAPPEGWPVATMRLAAAGGGVSVQVSAAPGKEKDAAQKQLQALLTTALKLRDVTRRQKLQMLLVCALEGVRVVDALKQLELLPEGRRLLTLYAVKPYTTF